MSLLALHTPVNRPLFAEGYEYLLTFDQGDDRLRFSFSGDDFVTLAPHIGVTHFPNSGTFVMGAPGLVNMARLITGWTPPDEWLGSPETGRLTIRALTTAISRAKSCTFTQVCLEPIKSHSALSTQVGGSHYQMPIQPMEFAMTQMYDFATSSILKYVSRHRQKNGRQDIEKALHIVELRAEIARKHDLPRLLNSVVAVRKVSGLTWVCSGDPLLKPCATDMDVYIRVNGFTGRDADALALLDSWFRNGSACHISRVLKTKLEAILHEYDGGPKARMLADPKGCEHDWLVHTDQDGRALGTVCGKCGTIG